MRQDGTHVSCLPGGRPPVPPGVRATGPDRKNRDRISTARADGTASQPASGRVSRRSLFRAAGVGAAVVGGGALLEACSSGIQGASSSSSSTSSTAAGSTSGGGTSKEITIGWIHPVTGSLAGFGYPQARRFFAWTVIAMFCMTLWLLFVQAFRLHAFCRYCLFSAALIFLLTGLVVARPVAETEKN